MRARAGSPEAFAHRRGSATKTAMGGEMPLDHLLFVMRDPSEDKRVRLDAAKAAAPYCHARLSSTELTGPDNGPIQTQDIPITKEMRVRAIMAMLEKAKREGLGEARVIAFSRNYVADAT